MLNNDVIKTMQMIQLLIIKLLFRIRIRRTNYYRTSIYFIIILLPIFDATTFVIGTSSSSSSSFHSTISRNAFHVKSTAFVNNNYSLHRSNQHVRSITIKKNQLQQQQQLLNKRRKNNGITTSKSLISSSRLFTIKETATITDNNAETVSQQQIIDVVDSTDKKQVSVVKIDNDDNMYTTTTGTTTTELVNDEEYNNDINSAFTRQKYTMLVLLWLVALISSLDRVSMSIALVPMSYEYYLTDSMKGLISSFFSLGYGICIIPAGLIIAYVSPRIILSYGIGIWSLATLLTPYSTELISISTLSISISIIPLLIMRGFVGAGETLVLPTVQKFLTIYTTNNEKGLAIGFIFSGFKTGTIIAYLLSPIILDTFNNNWRSLFYVYSFLGFIIMSLWLLFASDTPLLKTATTSLTQTTTTTPITQPIQQLLSSSSTTSYSESSISNNNNNTTTTESISLKDRYDEIKQSLINVPWESMIQSKGVWGMLLAHCSKNWALYNTLSWTPTFYYEQYNIGVRDSAILSVLPSCAGIVGGFISGYAADQLLQKLKLYTQKQQQQQQTNNNHYYNNTMIADDTTLYLTTMESSTNVVTGSTATITTDDIDNDTTTKTIVRKLFQSISLYGGGIALYTLAYNIPDVPYNAQLLITTSVFLQSFGTAGFEAGNQDKAGSKWAGLLYSITTLPAVMFGTFGVWATGRVLDITHQDWSYVFAITATINILGATAFLLLFDSKREFE